MVAANVDIAALKARHPLATWWRRPGFVRRLRYRRIANAIYGRS